MLKLHFGEGMVLHALVLVSSESSKPADIYIYLGTTQCLTWENDSLPLHGQNVFETYSHFIYFQKLIKSSNMLFDRLKPIIKMIRFL